MMRSLTGRSWLAALLALALLVLPACGNDTADTPTPSESPAASDPLAETSWTLESLTDASGEVSVPEQNRPTLQFAEGQANGNSGCNQYGGSYAVDGSGLTFGEMASTAMACEGPGNDIEVAYLAALGAVDSFAVDGDMLTLTGGDTTMVFAAGSPAALTGVTWIVNTLATTDALTGVVEDSAPTAMFGEDGTVSGTDGCNTYNAGYSLDGQTIDIEPLAMTKMACPGEDLQQQTIDFAAAMESAATYAVAGDTLTLYAEDGRILIMASTNPG